MYNAHGTYKAATGFEVDNSLPNLSEEDSTPSGHDATPCDQRTTRSTKGTTRLHADLTDAGNFAVEGLAEWTAFLAKDRPVVAQFIRDHAEQCGYVPPGDPIHNQQVFLTSDLLALLLVETGVRPFIILQRPGDFVVIPAGVLHQVRKS